jgi:HAE1 family hydrophobic/amphiphilic exporter-1
MDYEIKFTKELTSLQSILGTQKDPVIIEIKGEDLDVISSLTNLVKIQMDSLNEIFNVETSFDEGRPEINIIIDRVRAGVHNLDLGSISTQLKDYLQGRQAGNWESEGEMRDITITLPDVGINALREVYINNGQEEIRLDDIATFEETSSQNEIIRRNQSRIGKITAQIKGDLPLDHISALIRERLDEIPFPDGYQYAITGEEEMRAKSFTNLKFALLLSVILIYMVMASQFESLIHPFTVLLTLPLAAVGAIAIFFILGLPFNVMAYIGIIMLMGIAVNDSIILVDEQIKAAGYGIERSHRGGRAEKNTPYYYDKFNDDPRITSLNNWIW